MAKRDMNSGSSALEEHYRTVAADHYAHWFILLCCAGYAWQIHGFLIGVAVLVATLAAIIVSNFALLAATGSFKVLKFNRWLWLCLAIVAVAISGTETVVFS